jgi:hypothetical protein
MIEHSIKFDNHLMVFKVYVHFAIYCDDYNFFTNIYFNHLISISKWDFFYNLILWVLNYLIPSTIAKNPININLIKIQSHIISKNNIFDSNI